jgi:CheY-like chemotaxis protein
VITVYVGEDDPTQALYLSKILSRIVHSEPKVFGDGLSLYQAVQEDPPDLIISDNVLPKLDGVDIARLIKYHDQTRGIPFLLVSAIQSDNLEGYDDCGADGFLCKPVRQADLRAVIESFFGEMGEG